MRGGCRIGCLSSAVRSQKGGEKERDMKPMAGEKGMSLGAEKEQGAVGGGSGLRTAETLLRVVPMGLCLAALVVMLKDVQSTADFGSVSYADLTGFRYLVYANGVCAVYSLFSAFYTAMPRRPTIRRVWAIYFLDQVLTYVILGAGAVSAEILYLTYNGDDKVTWSQQCGIFGGFCRKATVSVGITFGAVACYLVLSLVSSYHLFSTYETPIPFFLGSRGIEIASFPG